MCGRFTNELTWSELHSLYKLSDLNFPSAPPSNLQPRYNIAPTQQIDIAHLDKAGQIELDRARWSLIPFFSKEVPKFATMNARIETVATSGAFREAFKSKRCLVPADGYFEWTIGEDGKKDPWLLQLPDGRPFSFAGLWSYNDKVSIPAGAEPGVTSCTIITAPAVAHIAHIHDRMPVILEEDAYEAWLDPETPAEELMRLLQDHHLDAQLVFHRVSRQVNTYKYDGTDTKLPILNPL